MTKGRNAVLQWIYKGDLHELVGIEQECFEHCWTEDEFRRRLAANNVTGRIVRHDDVARGFVIFQYDELEMHILNLAVSPSWRRLGFGRLLVESVAACRLGGNRIRAVVRDRNLGTHLFLKALGFKAVKMWPRYYYDGDDAYVFLRHLQELKGGTE